MKNEFYSSSTLLIFSYKMIFGILSCKFTLILIVLFLIYRKVQNYVTKYAFSKIGSYKDFDTITDSTY